MNDTEKRRRQLLDETRKRYGDTRTAPAVHPRYNSVYENLYGSEEEKAGSVSGFGIRLIVAIMLFALFIAVDNEKIKAVNVDSKRIVSEIEKIPDVKWNNWDFYMKKFTRINGKR